MGRYDVDATKDDLVGGSKQFHTCSIFMPRNGMIIPTEEHVFEGHQPEIYLLNILNGFKSGRLH
jgi:hypothetical protein